MTNSMSSPYNKHHNHLHVFMRLMYIAAKDSGFSTPKKSNYVYLSVRQYPYNHVVSSTPVIYMHIHLHMPSIVNLKEQPVIYTPTFESWVWNGLTLCVVSAISVAVHHLYVYISYVISVHSHHCSHHSRRQALTLDVSHILHSFLTLTLCMRVCNIYCTQYMYVHNILLYSSTLNIVLHFSLLIHFVNSCED